MPYEDISILNDRLPSPNQDPDQIKCDYIREGIMQLNEPKLQYLKTNILLSSLRNIVDDGRLLSPETASKIKKILLFGDLNEYLDPPSSIALMSKPSTILDIPKEWATRNLSLTESERSIVIKAVTEDLRIKNKSIADMFKLIAPNDNSSQISEKMKELPSHLKVAIETTTSSEVMVNLYDNFLKDVEKCYEEMRRMYESLDELVKIRLNVSSQGITLTEAKNLRATCMEGASRLLHLTAKKDFYTPETVEALKIMNAMQKEELEKKKAELSILRKEMALYEQLYIEGFDDLLKEYINVENKILEHKSTFKDMFNKSLNDNKNEIVNS